MSFIGNTPTTQSFISGTETFNGNGSTVAFTLSRTVASVNDIEVVVNNVIQQPNSAYTISGTTITFTGAPSAGTSNIYVRYLSTTTQSITPSQNSVGYNQLTTDVQNDLGISFKNRIINGDMRIDQRNAGASVTPTSDGTYTLDRWVLRNTQASKVSIQQNAGSVTPPVGFTNYLGVTSLSSYSVSASDFFNIRQIIEGFNAADLGWGTADAKTVTLSFWVRSSLTGTFGGCINNNAFDRSYPFTYTISSANTWTQISVTIAGSISGTWLTTNSSGIAVSFGLGIGSTNSGTAGVWASTQYLGATGATSVVGTSGATFYLTGVQLEVGTQATTFDYRSYGTELALCQRYFQKTYNIGTKPAATGGYAGGIYSGALFAYNNPSIGGGSVGITWQYKASMRTIPTITAYSPATGTAGFFTGGSTDYVFGINAPVIGENNSLGYGTSTGSNDCYFHMTASAEL